MKKEKRKMEVESAFDDLEAFHLLAQFLIVSLHFLLNGIVLPLESLFIRALKGKGFPGIKASHLKHTLLLGNQLQKDPCGFSNLALFLLPHILHQGSH